MTGRIRGAAGGGLPATRATEALTGPYTHPAAEALTSPYTHSAEVTA